MRRFSSYGPVNKKIHYYSPRKGVIENAYTQLMGENPEEGGHYVTAWAPRQAGKTWTLQQILFRLKKSGEFDVAYVSLGSMESKNDPVEVQREVTEEILRDLNKNDTQISRFKQLFSKNVLDKPLILVLDEFDCLQDNVLSEIVRIFRDIYTKRNNQTDKKTAEKDYLLHAAALIGVRSVLGIENKQGSPFNVQRSIHIPNLTYQEVETMFRWYEKDSQREIDKEVIDRIYYEFRGQPGLTCWFGELLSEGWELTSEPTGPIRMQEFKSAYSAASQILPNANVVNIVSKVRPEKYKKIVLEIFRTDKKIRFRYDDDAHNYLYMNGIIEREMEKKNGEERFYIKFSSPFIQKRLFNFLAGELFDYMGILIDPFEDIENAVNEIELNIRNILKFYRKYLKKNSGWLLKEAPKRSDMRIYEAVFHFNLYSYLSDFLTESHVYPEFPTGNGKIDLIIKHAGKIYGLELKVYTNQFGYKEALKKAVQYARQLKLPEITLVFFIDKIDDQNRDKFEADYFDKETGIKVMPCFIETGDKND